MSDSTERWRTLEELYQAALERPSSARTAFLRNSCADESLRREVEALLHARGAGDDLLERPAIRYAAPPLEPGAVLGHYRIEQRIGGGGMGVVYRAEDSRLARKVAIKALSDSFLTERGAIERFWIEARAVSALNHPNICTVHDVGESNSQPYLVMELLEGSTLKERIEGRPLPIAELIQWATETASGLEAAHAEGIIHRDLKPANIFITRAASGRHEQVKILDFGLAKRIAAEPDGAMDTTRTVLTKPGSAVGTVKYMSPEQARGEEVDPRTDLFSFGAVLYEMATGRQPFSGATDALVFQAILAHSPPQPTRWNPDIPRKLEQIIEKALRKDREHRYQSAAELRADLERLKVAMDSGGVPAPKPRRPGAPLRKQWGALALAGVLLIAAVIGSLLAFTRAHRAALVQKIDSLVVLPVKNFSGDPGQQFFADGMTDALIAGLAQIKAVRVISRTSAMHYKDTNETLPQIARELGVDGVVESSVMRSAGRVRVTAQLLEGRNDRHLWAGSYEREMTDVLVLQSEVVQAIADAIRVEITSQETQRLKTSRKIEPAVYDDTIKADAMLEYAFHEDQIRQSIDLYRKVIDRDPTYSRTWAGLSLALWRLAQTKFEFVAPQEVRGEAIAAADRAMALDPNLAEALCVRALVAFDGCTT